MLVNFSNHIPHLVVGTLLLPDRESAKIHSNQANPIIRGPNQSLTSPTGMHNSLPLLNPNYSIANVHPDWVRSYDAESGRQGGARLDGSSGTAATIITWEVNCRTRALGRRRNSAAANQSLDCTPGGRRAGQPARRNRRSPAATRSGECHSGERTHRYTYYVRQVQWAQWRQLTGNRLMANQRYFARLPSPRRDPVRRTDSLSSCSTTRAGTTLSIHSMKR